MKTVSLLCFAPDGKFVTENQFLRESRKEAIKAAWLHENDMGSRWVFYPIRVVIDAESEIIISASPDLILFMNEHCQVLADSLAAADQENLIECLNEGYFPLIEKVKS